MKLAVEKDCLEHVHSSEYDTQMKGNSLSLYHIIIKENLRNETKREVRYSFKITNWSFIDRRGNLGRFKCMQLLPGAPSQRYWMLIHL